MTLMEQSKAVPMDLALYLVRIGVLEIRPNGQIWKLAKFDRNGNIVPIRPKRAEYLMNTGYLGVHFKIEGDQYSVTAHRLFWTYTHGPIPPGMDINHKDGVRNNDDPTNLELLSRGDNHRHAYSTGLRPVTDKQRAALLLGHKAMATKRGHEMPEIRRDDHGNHSHPQG